MTWHSMVLEEPHPTKTGFISRYYAIVDVEMSGSKWIWCQVDNAGNFVGSASSTFATEDDALHDALNKLKGTSWE